MYKTKPIGELWAEKASGQNEFYTHQDFSLLSFRPVFPEVSANPESILLLDDKSLGI